MFIAYDVSLDLIRSLCSVVATIKAKSRDTADQIEEGSDQCRAQFKQRGQSADRRW